MAAGLAEHSMCYCGITAFVRQGAGQEGVPIAG